MKRISFFFFLIIFLIGAGFVWWRNGNSPANSQDKNKKMFVVERGEAIREIGNKLKAAGLIRDPIVFFIAIKKDGFEKSIQAGDYRLSPAMPLSQIIDTLRHGMVDMWVTFPEGLRAEEYAEILKNQIPSYRNSWIQELKLHEGYLFPDTYLIPKDADITSIISLLTNTFYKKTEGLNVQKGSQKLYNTVIIASLLEREALTLEEKPVIAGIIQNRIDAGMPLQIDATVQYAKGYDVKSKKWWAPVYIEDYKGVHSSYNTYLIQGLPPGPISNPGFESIKAALTPANTPYYFYLHDKNGNIHYAKTSGEHERNVEKYIN